MEENIFITDFHIVYKFKWNSIIILDATLLRARETYIRLEAITACDAL
jgi:hypothetical protein